LQLRNLDDIQTNFRVKEVYAQKNSLSDISGIKSYKFLTTLLCGDNQLRDLDKFIEFLNRFSFLKQLDLFGNPLAEEPDYRLKIIHAMPQLYVLDRHRITVPER
jgi:Leucine-rich repeat (LRR) protein